MNEASRNAHRTATDPEEDHGRPYAILAAMATLHFVAMYAIMYAMVDVFSNVYNNFNQVYMAGMMTAPMIIMELLLMRKMYSRQAANLVIIAASAVVLVLFFLFVRQQAAIGNEQFLRSMIPHHAGAILMCREASITDGEIRDLCVSILESQEAEIEQMKAILARLNAEAG